MHPAMIAVYLLLCALLGALGRKTRVGAFGVFLLSVLFTPLVVGIVLALARPSPHQRPTS